MKQERLKTKPHCPQCNKILDSWTHVNEKRPAPGDITVCLYCSAVLEFGENWSLDFASVDTLMNCDLIELQHVHKIVRNIRDKLKNKVLEIIQTALSNAEDNLTRANMQFGKMTIEGLKQKYGESESTCGEILDQYQTRYNELKQCAVWVNSIK